VDDSILTHRERRQLAELRRRQREFRETIVRRVETQIESLQASKYRYQQAWACHVAACTCYHEALLLLAEDPDDDDRTAREKTDKLERIEAEFIAAGAALRNAFARCEWEIREAGASSSLEGRPL
jgi:hypothetical protein